MHKLPESCSSNSKFFIRPSYFQQFADEPSNPEGEGELMTLIERKHSDTFEKPTEALLKAARKNKLPPNESGNIDLKSMMYLS